MKKEKVDTSKGPDPKSRRSKKRLNRNFKSIETSTRKGRRATKRSNLARTISGRLYDAGEKIWTNATAAQKSWLHTAGGSNHPHKV